MQLNEDAQHAPLSNKGHLSTMVDGAPCRSTCGHLCQLEVCKLLQCGDQVVYPKGLNGDLEPVQTLLSGSLIWGMDTLGEPTCEPSFLLVDLSCVTLGDHTPKAPAPCRTSTPPPSPHSATECPSSTGTHPSMATKLHEFLSWAMLDTSSQASWGTTPGRPTSVALGNAPTSRVEDLPELKRPVLAIPKPVATFQLASPQADMLDDTVPSSCLQLFVPLILLPETPEVVSIPTEPPSKKPTGADTGALPNEVLHLQGEMNRVMAWLLTTRASMDAHHRKQVWDTKPAFQQNEAQTTKGIREAEAVWAAAIRKAKVCCATVIQDEATCAAAIREVPTTCACILQQLHSNGMQSLEREAIEEEERNHQSFLTACGVALQVCLPEACGVLMFPLQLLTGNMSLASLFAIPPGHLQQQGNLPLQLPIQLFSGPHVQMVMPFIWGGGYRTSNPYQRAYSSEAKRGEVPCGAQGKLPGGLSLRLQFSLHHQVVVFWGTSLYFWPKGIP